MRLGGIVFDFDGVIIDSETGWYESVRLVFDDHGLEFPEHRWHEAVGAAEEPDWVSDLEREIGRQLDRADVRRRRMTHYRRISDSLELVPGIQELLDEAAAAGLPLAIASNSPRSWVESHLERIGLRDRFQALCCLDDVTFGKPHPEPYLCAARALGVRPQDAVAIEDTPTGLASAKAAGLVCVAVPRGLTEVLSFDDADLVAPSIGDLDVARLAALVEGSRRIGA